MAFYDEPFFSIAALAELTMLTMTQGPDLAPYHAR